MKKIIELEMYGGNTWAHKKWAKIVVAVDQSKNNGYAFQGDFLNLDRKHELEVGTYILQYGEFGDSRSGKINIRLLRVTADGLEEIKEWEDLGKSWALGCRDEIAEIVNTKEETNPLEAYSVEDLLAELKRRGVKIG